MIENYEVGLSHSITPVPVIYDTRFMIDTQNRACYNDMKNTKGDFSMSEIICYHTDAMSIIATDSYMYDNTQCLHNDYPKVFVSKKYPLIAGLVGCSMINGHNLIDILADKIENNIDIQFGIRLGIESVQAELMKQGSQNTSIILSYIESGINHLEEYYIQTDRITKVEYKGTQLLFNGVSKYSCSGQSVLFQMQELNEIKTHMVKILNSIITTEKLINVTPLVGGPVQIVSLDIAGNTSFEIV